MYLIHQTKVLLLHPKQDKYLIYIKNKTMKKHFLLAEIAVLMLVARNNKPASELTSVEVYTNEPGIQVYTDNFLPGQTYNSECIFKFSVEK